MLLDEDVDEDLDEDVWKATMTSVHATSDAVVNNRMAFVESGSFYKNQA